MPPALSGLALQAAWRNSIPTRLVTTPCATTPAFNSEFQSCVKAVRLKVARVDAFGVPTFNRAASHIGASRP